MLKLCRPFQQMLITIVPDLKLFRDFQIRITRQSTSEGTLKKSRKVIWNKYNNSVPSENCRWVCVQFGWYRESTKVDQWLERPLTWWRSGVLFLLQSRFSVLICKCKLSWRGNNSSTHSLENYIILSMEYTLA